MCINIGKIGCLTGKSNGGEAVPPRAGAQLADADGDGASGRVFWPDPGRWVSGQEPWTVTSGLV